LGDEYERAFWLGQVARQITDDRQTLLEMIEGRVAIPNNEKVSWADVLALDLLGKEIDALRAKAW
jgi:hypothetical protein